MRISLLLSCLLLSACTATQEPPETSADQAPKKEPNTQMQDAIHAPIDKANKVEGQVLDDAEKQKADIEAAGG